MVVRHGRLLVRPRPQGAPLAGAWEFPGGKIAAGEAPAAAALRELAEETGLRAPGCEPLAVSEWADRSVRLQAFLVLDAAGIPDPSWSWLTLEELASRPLPAANGPILRALRERG